MRESGAAVVQAEPGAGKTTRIPPALMEEFGAKGEIWVLEPRRIAARLAAVRVASELREEPGGRVGYTVRHEQVGGRGTRLRFMTEGVLARAFIDDPLLSRAAVIVLDEFHERSLQADLALAVAKRLRDGMRPDLRVLVMSATLDTEEVAGHLGEAPIVRSEGRCHPVTISYEEMSKDPLHKRVVRAVRRELRSGTEGDLLVFLPGAGEIRRSREELTGLASERGVDLVMLHGSLPAKEQDRAVAAGPRRKIILATNVAETSITLPSVTTVIDSGLARVAVHSPWTGLSSLEVRPISRSSATQRAGRAGRIGPGRCMRLYDAHDLERRPESERPEILRSDLADTLLTLAAAGIFDPYDLPWLDEPPKPAVEAASNLLVRLGALGPGGRITEAGKRIAALPLHPRQARLLIEAQRLGVAELACPLCAIIGERDIIATRPDLARSGASTTGPCDLLERLDLFLETSRRGKGGRSPRHSELDAGALRAVGEEARRLQRILGLTGPRRLPTEEEEAALRLCVLSAWPDRVAKRRKAGAPRIVLAEGGEAKLSDRSVVKEAEWLVAVDASSGPSGAIVHLATSIEPDWLMDLFPERIEERTEVVWNQKARRVEAFSRMLFGIAVLAESRESASVLPEAWRMLSEEALRMGLSAFADAGRVEALAGRLRLAAQAEPASGYFELNEESLRFAVERMCRGKSRFEELSTEALIQAILEPLPHASRARLEVLAPTHIALPRRKRAPVSYPPDAQPFVSSRIQDFFGLREAPKIGGGRVPLVLHLLAPSNRPVQVTADLSGFWQRHYPSIRKELSRRYPRHSWPEDPLSS